jgi:Ran GTPase-activating protein (RanGAP) involved in mRNA processing and transport
MAKQGQQNSGKVRKSTKGIPRVTDKVLAMDEAKRQEWLGKVPPQHRAEVEARLTEALKEGRKPRKIDFAHIFDGRTVEELTSAKSHLDAALAKAAETAEATLAAEIAAKEAQLKAIRAAKGQESTPAAAAAGSSVPA